MILVIDISAQAYGVNMYVINLKNTIIEHFMKHAELDYPHECCGFILGNFSEQSSFGVKYLPAANTKKENRERRFLIDPIAYQNAEDKADNQGLSIISIIHSHQIGRASCRERV